MSRIVHIIGAGLAGLSAATVLAEAGEAVALYEATGHAGGRCRSYSDPALDMPIDNGNHIILSGNRSALAFLKRTGGAVKMAAPPSPSFSFVDMSDGARWVVELGQGRIPWWVLNRERRVPGTRLVDYLAPTRLMLGPGSGTVGSVIDCAGPLYQRLLGPMLLAMLNNDPRLATARLAATVIRETIAAGGSACRPLVAMDGLSAAYVDPAVDYLRARGARLDLGKRLRRMHMRNGHVAALDFGGMAVSVDESDAVILALPPNAVARLLPDMTVPTEFRSIVNLHYRVAASVDWTLIGVINGVAHWIFAFPGRLSVTISNADDLLAVPRAALARLVWKEVAAIASLPNELPPWQAVVERRATFATSPGQEERRPSTRTRLRNLFLAGDWVATGLPPTIESAVRSGERAAALAAA